MFPHESDRFVDFYDYSEDDKEGFKLQDGSKFIYLSNKGYQYDFINSWVDENGCCYDAEGNPDGWFIYTMISMAILCQKMKILLNCQNISQVTRRVKQINMVVIWKRMAVIMILKGNH